MTTAVQVTAGVTITAAELRKAIGWVKPSKGWAPGTVFTGVRVTVSGGRLILAYYDQETALAADLEAPATVGGVASVVVDWAQLRETVMAHPPGKTPIEIMVHDQDQVDVTAGKHRVSVEAIDTAWQYPQLPAPPPPVGALPGPGFRDVLGRVAPMASDKPELPWLGAVRMRATRDGLDLTATDRYRIGAEEVPWLDPVTADADVLFPAGLAARFSKVSDGPAVFLFVGAVQGPKALSGPDAAALSDGTWTVITRPPYGDPIDIRKYLAGKDTGGYAAALTVDAAALAALLAGPAKVKVAEGAQTTFVDLLAVPGEKVTMRLECGVTQWSGEIDAELAGEKLVAGFNPAYLASMMACLDGPAVIQLTANDSGRVLTPAKVTGQSAPGWTGMVVPVKPKGN
jgi:DNA polymerase III sliding clamp (beta) subunit (PCNA family)